MEIVSLVLILHYPICPDFRRLQLYECASLLHHSARFYDSVELCAALRSPRTLQKLPSLSGSCARKCYFTDAEIHLFLQKVIDMIILQLTHNFFSFSLVNQLFGGDSSTTTTATSPDLGDWVQNNLLLIGFPDPTTSVRRALQSNILALFFSVLAQALYKKLNQYYNKFKLHIPPEQKMAQKKESKKKSEKKKKINPMKELQKEQRES